jgi:hypothetical protein
MTLAACSRGHNPNRCLMAAPELETLQKRGAGYIQVERWLRKKRLMIEVLRPDHSTASVLSQ